MTLKPLSQRYPAEDIEVSRELPERNLLAAVLERAIRDILNIETDAQQHCASACVWLRSQAETEFSFKWICFQLDISPKYIRRYIYELKAKGARFDVYQGASRGLKVQPL
jgi:hypothetical protein